MMKRDIRVQLAGAAIAYVAVALGHYALNRTWVTLVVYHGGIVAYVLATKQLTAVRELVRGWRTGLALASMGVFALAGLAIWHLWPLAALPDVDFAAMMSQRGLGGWRFWAFAAAIVFINPALEEILWRGCLVDDVRRPSWIDAAFGGFHLFGAVLIANLAISVLIFFLLAAVSWYLRWVRAATGGLAVCWAAHTAADVSIVWAMHLLMQ
jgi:membrane protease YdiL (CAAX protease family)